MKLLYTLAFLFCSTLVIAQNNNPNYDAKLADSLGADAYGMKKFVLVILKTGTNTDKDQAKINKSFAGHMANINTLVENKKLIVAGPIGKNNNSYRGIFILDVPTLEEAKKLLQTDPAIKDKYLAADVYEWYGSAALATYLEASDKIWKVNP